MKTRIITALVGLPIIIALVHFGGAYLLAVLVLLSVLGFVELFKAYAQDTKKSHNKGLVAVFGLVYVFGLFACVFLVREFFGAAATWLIFIAAWGCDTGAYFVGKAFGKRKLAPRLSPNKTVAGAIGGIITAAVLCAAYVLILSHFQAVPSIYPPPQSTLVRDMTFFAAYGAIAAMLAMGGDLFASAIKRRTGIKDFGVIIPGHGGVLDRFDSILFVAPFALAVLFFI